MKLTFLNCQCPVRNRLFEEETYYRRLDITLLFGLAELGAVAAWKQNVVPL